MPINVHYNYESNHTVRKVGGLISAVPALPTSSRLYVIHHLNAHGRPYYIGTASNVKERFKERFRAVRELGFRTAEINNLRIAVVQILIDGVSRTPQDYGIAGGIDVEHLLIRLYIAFGHRLRNIDKTGNYQNTHGQRLDCYFTNPSAWAHFVPANNNVPNNYYV